MVDPAAKRRQHYFECLLLAYVMLDRTALKGWRRPKTTRACKVALRYAESLPQSAPVNEDSVFDSTWDASEKIRAHAALLTEAALKLTVYDLQLWPRDSVLQQLGATQLPPSTKAGRLLQMAEHEATSRPPTQRRHPK